jgi:hypothetical protein
MTTSPKPKPTVKKKLLPFFTLLLKSGSYDRKKLINDYIKIKTMKSTLLILLTLCFLNGMGQQPDLNLSRHGDTTLWYNNITKDSVIWLNGSSGNGSIEITTLPRLTTMYATITPSYDTVRCVMLVSDTSRDSFGTGIVYWMKGYSVREKHNTSEGVNDPYFSRCIDDNGNEVPCYHDYWKHLCYLDADKHPLPKNILVWEQR